MRGGPRTLHPQHRMLPTVRWKEGGLMQYGNLVPDLVCGRCKHKIAMAVLTEAVYQDGMWWHTASVSTAIGKGLPSSFGQRRSRRCSQQASGGWS